LLPIPLFPAPAAPPANVGTSANVGPPAGCGDGDDRDGGDSDGDCDHDCDCNCEVCSGLRGYDSGTGGEFRSAKIQVLGLRVKG
jgi:hypothetical protein